MDNDAKKTALRMIPYGLYVSTAEDGDGNVAAATVNWVTQAAFEPPLVAVGVKAESGAHALIKSTGSEPCHSGSTDDATLWLEDLGEKVVYGG